MDLNRIKCPDCEGVLRLAKAPDPGKRIKCPKCGAKFALAEEEPPPVTKKKTTAVPSAAGKKNEVRSKAPSPKQDKGRVPAKPAAKAPVKGKEDNTYGVIKEEGEQGPKPIITFGRDTRTKDLRGPAQQAVVPPTNMLIIVGGAGFFGWLALLIMVLLPLFFPISSSEGSQGNILKVLEIPEGLSAVASSSPPTFDAEVIDPPWLLFFGFNLATLNLFHTWMIALIILIFPAMMLFSGYIISGAVRAQNLESRRAGIISSVLIMLPLNTGGLMIVIVVGFGFVARMILDDTDYLLLMLSLMITAAGVGTGIWGLRVFNDEKVIAGFEYKPE